MGLPKKKLIHAISKFWLASFAPLGNNAGSFVPPKNFDLEPKKKSMILDILFYDFWVISDVLEKKNSDIFLKIT